MLQSTAAPQVTDRVAPMLSRPTGDRESGDGPPKSPVEAPQVIDKAQRLHPGINLRNLQFKATSLAMGCYPKTFKREGRSVVVKRSQTVGAASTGFAAVMLALSSCKGGPKRE